MILYWIRRIFQPMHLALTIWVVVVLGSYVVLGVSTARFDPGSFLLFLGVSLPGALLIGRLWQVRLARLGLTSQEGGIEFAAHLTPDTYQRVGMFLPGFGIFFAAGTIIVRVTGSSIRLGAGVPMRDTLELLLVERSEIERLEAQRVGWFGLRVLITFKDNRPSLAVKMESTGFLPSVRERERLIAALADSLGAGLTTYETRGLRYKDIWSSRPRVNESMRAFQWRHVALYGAMAVLAGLVVLFLSLVLGPPLTGGWIFLLSGVSIAAGVPVVVLGAVKYRSASRGGRSG